MHNTKNTSNHTQYVTKRDGTLQVFDIQKVVQAIYKAMVSVDNGSLDDANNIALDVLAFVEREYPANHQYPNVEHIQDLVEQELMKHEYYNVAKSYILYRQHRAELRKRDIFKKRLNLKPYEYPELYEYVSAIRHSYWIYTEFN